MRDLLVVIVQSRKHASGVRTPLRLPSQCLRLLNRQIESISARPLVRTGLNTLEHFVCEDALWLLRFQNSAKRLNQFLSMYKRSIPSNPAVLNKGSIDIIAPSIFCAFDQYEIKKHFYPLTTEFIN